MNRGLKLTQEGNVNQEKNIESNNSSMIVTLQINQLNDSSRKVTEDGRYADTNILLDTGSTCSVFKSNNMLLNIRAND